MASGIAIEDAATPDGTRLVAIGDIHGCLGLLDTLLEAIDAEIAADRPDDWRILTLGDHTDRGPNSRGVIDRLIERSDDPRHLSLCGNHDAGMLSFLTNGDSHRLFVEFGGLQTAASYGVTLDTSDGARLEASRQALIDAVPSTHLAFLTGLRASAGFGDYFFCHAGIRPGIPLDQQAREDLIWIRQEFLTCGELHPKLIVHGHTPADHPEILRNRINIDTRAYSTSVLTALVAEGTKKWLLQASEDGVARRELA
ncbi:serine/threonine protein phosphatase [Pseudohoeflea suaedae]|uniref:Serine/threonine protein phosphatase n=1 Tax=Pseudohoeflea suaedae TaxID=877384 RepID=A0A4R5PNC4_9HYPH|nr:metallophosphoesterase [Pseudohoeflea suaedae]TDH38459.1 serine/threonine protein phosphatase [Pseudohoeflea suaedae]